MLQRRFWMAIVLGAVLGAVLGSVHTGAMAQDATTAVTKAAITRFGLGGSAPWFA
jgi:hypothetical protein